MMLPGWAWIRWLNMIPQSPDTQAIALAMQAEALAKADNEMMAQYAQSVRDMAVVAARLRSAELKHEPKAAEIRQALLCPACAKRIPIATSSPAGRTHVEAEFMEGEIGEA